MHPGLSHEMFHGAVSSAGVRRVFAYGKNYSMASANVERSQNDDYYYDYFSIIGLAAQRISGTG